MGYRFVVIHNNRTNRNGSLVQLVARSCLNNLMTADANRCGADGLRSSGAAEMFCVYVLVVRQLDTTRTVRVPSPRGRIGIRNYWLRSQSALKRVGKLAYRMQTWYIWPGPVERPGGAMARR